VVELSRRFLLLIDVRRRNGSMGIFDFFLSGKRRRVALEGAFEAALTGDLVQALERVDSLPVRARGKLLCELSDRLRSENRDDLARQMLGVALERAPDHSEALERRMALEIGCGDLEAALSVCERLRQAAPTMFAPVRTQADLLLALERPEDALAAIEASPHADDPILAVRRGKALLALDREEDALELLTEVRDYFESQMRQAMSHGDWQLCKEQYEDAAMLTDELEARLNGRESLVVAPAMKGKLDGKSGSNYRLLGESLMVGAPRLAAVLELQTPEETARRAEELLRVRPKDVDGLALKASARLRAGKVGEAKELFERACEADGRCFVGFVGLGAVLDHERHRLREAAERLPSRPEPPGLPKVVPDLAALTSLERKVVCACAFPFRAALPLLAARGAHLRLLPVDVRATDLSELAGIEEERSDDHRSYEAIGGLANRKIAVARAEELLDVASEHGLVFAHELAHLVFFHLPQERRAPFEALYERALEIGWATKAYALENVDELFAVSYTEWLRGELELPLQGEPDDEGLSQELGRLFGEIAGTEALDEWRQPWSATIATA
jgi:tetratricopeptide (TPR) repeat protein